MSAYRPLATIWPLLIAIFLTLMPTPAPAAVEVAFYSKELGATFPHAFIRVTGTVDATGEGVDASYGFTAKSISPAILFGSVPGEVVSSEPDYIKHSDRHFAFTLSDEEYRTLLTDVERWRTLDQPSYNLNRQNCVFFVADMAKVLGMKVSTPKGLMKKPRSFIIAMMEANREWLQARHAAFGS